MGLTQKRRNSIASAMELRLFFALTHWYLYMNWNVIHENTVVMTPNIHKSPLQILVTKVVKPTHLWTVILIQTIKS